MYYIGIDPGKDGGLVILSEDGRIVEKYKTPLIRSSKSRNEYDIPGIARILKSRSPIFVFLEKGQPMPMSGISAQFHRGFSFGLYQGLLVGMGIPYEVISPRYWQKVMLANVNTEDTKLASILVAKRIWPKEDWRKSQRATKDDHGLTDAALIGEFGRRSRMPALKV